VNYCKWINIKQIKEKSVVLVVPHSKNRSLIQYKDYVGPNAVGCNTLMYVIHFQVVRRDNPGLEPTDLNLSMDLDKDLNLRTPMEIK
jgi:hypothetical protein